MSIELIIGPMFSGKSTELLRRVRRYKISGKKCIILKHSKDTRYHDFKVATHDNIFYDAIPCSKLLYEYDEYDVIGIDEGQFFSDIVEYSENMANRGKIVIIAALDGTFQRKAFNDILNVIPKADKVDRLNAVCMTRGCNINASFSKRITNETDIEVIGGSDKYVAMCRKCYFKDL